MDEFDDAVKQAQENLAEVRRQTTRQVEAAQRQLSAAVDAKAKAERVPEVPTAESLGSYYQELCAAGITADLAERIVFDAATSIHAHGVLLGKTGDAA